MSAPEAPGAEAGTVGGVDLHHIHRAFERAQGLEQRRERHQSLSVGLLMVLVIGAVLVALLVGVTLYGDGHRLDQATSRSRETHGLLVNSLLAADLAGEVSTMAGPEGDALVISEDTGLGVFETRYYLYQGQLVKDYALEGAELSPSRAVPLMDARDFSFSYDPWSIEVTVDGTSQTVARRFGEVSP